MSTDWTQPEPANQGVPDLDLGALERAARAATPGEWASTEYAVWTADRRAHIAQLFGGGDGEEKRDPARVNAAYIAAWSPATALRVLAELRAARDAAADAVEDR